MSTYKRIGLVWLVLAVLLPLLTYAGSRMANLTGLPFDTGCNPYDMSVAATTSALVGCTFSVFISFLLMLPIVKKRVSWKLTLNIIVFFAILIGTFIVYQSNWCK